MSWPDGSCTTRRGVTLLRGRTRLSVGLTSPVRIVSDGPSDIDLMDQLSRVVSGHTGPRKDFYSATHTSTFKVSGRHILNVWRICRAEMNLTQYTFENVVFHLLHQR